MCAAAMVGRFDINDPANLSELIGALGAHGETSAKSRLGGRESSLEILQKGQAERICIGKDRVKFSVLRTLKTDPRKRSGITTSPQHRARGSKPILSQKAHVHSTQGTFFTDDCSHPPARTDSAAA